MPGTEPYPPVLSALIWPIVWICVLGGFLIGRKLYRLLRKRLALSTQRRLTVLQKEGADELVAAALRRIEEIRAALTRGSMHPSEAAEQLSAIGRTVTDRLWNQRTMYRSKIEVDHLRLQQLAVSMGVAYPLEFDDKLPHNTNPLLLCDYITEVVQICYR